MYPAEANSNRAGLRVVAQNNYFTEMCSGSEAGSYLRLIDFCNKEVGREPEKFRDAG